MIVNSIIHGSFSPRQIVSLFYGSQAGFSRADSLSSLWFFPCLFIAVCLFEFLQIVLSGRKYSHLILGTVSIGCALISYFLPHFDRGWPWSLDVSLFALALIICGYLGKELIKILSERIIVSVIVLIVSFVLLTLTFSINLKFISINNVDMAGRHFGNLGLYVLDALSGCLMILSFSCIGSRWDLFEKAFSFIGRRTIPILVIHKPIVQGLGNLLSRTILPKAIIVVISSGVAIGFSLLVYQVLHRWIPILFGEKKQATNRGLS